MHPCVNIYTVRFGLGGEKVRKKSTLCTLAKKQKLWTTPKVVFLPINTTSKLQPLDVGIIKNFKCHYRKLLLNHVLSQIDGSSLSASEIVKSVNVLTAIR